MDNRRVITRNERLAMDREDKITRAEVLSAISRQPRRKTLSKKEVVRIVELYGKGITNMSEIGRQTGVDASKVRSVLLGRSYRQHSGLYWSKTLPHKAKKWSVRLTRSEEPNIRTLRQQGYSIKMISWIYRTSSADIRRIIKGQSLFPVPA